MRMLIQKVSQAKVVVANETVGAIGKGALVFFAAHRDDDPSQIEWMADKLLNLRIFPNEQGKPHYSLLDLQAEVLIASQFTLYANCLNGRRPDFFAAAPAEKALPIYEAFVARVRSALKKVETGSFGAHMDVHLVNDGPMTFILETPTTEKKYL